MPEEILKNCEGCKLFGGDDCTINPYVYSACPRLGLVEEADLYRIPQMLHDSEIHCRIDWEFDKSWVVDITDGIGNSIAVGDAENQLGACIKLAELAVEEYPESVFANWWYEYNKGKK